MVLYIFLQSNFQPKTEKQDRIQGNKLLQEISDEIVKGERDSILLNVSAFGVIQYPPLFCNEQAFPGRDQLSLNAPTQTKRRDKNLSLDISREKIDN